MALKLYAGLFVLLSPSSGKLLTTFDLPHPGHVLIYGPTVGYYIFSVTLQIYIFNLYKLKVVNSLL